MGEKVCKVIKELYTENKATILVNGEQTRQININRGTKQGCPLSPALFSLAIEPLANSVRNNPAIKGYKVGKEVIKINLYADDVMIILGEVEESLQSIVRTVKDFGITSGLTINLGKSEILHKNLTWEELKKVQNIMGIKLGNKKMKYLGVDIPKNINNIIPMNYNHLWKNMSKQIISWGKKFRDISSRLKIYKMKILPKFLFLFQTLPVNIPINLLKKWDNSFKKWVVGGNKNRIANFLYYSKQELGGWGAPSLGLYNEASQLVRLLEFELEGSKKWVQIEKEANNWLKGPSMGERIDIKDLKNIKAGPFLTMLSIWKKWQTKLQINKIDPFPLETLENKDKTFRNIIKALKENGIKRIGDLMDPNGEILKWDKIKDKCGQGNWIAWLGLSSKAQAMKRREVGETPLDRIIRRKLETDKGMIGLWYDVLITLTYNTKEMLTEIWKQEKKTLLRN
uniref:Reverse transcriptase domain-containing protein n=1 Tax=Anolis carolinensis TaxID=28377 RepID=A0A803TXI3_ANOCA